MICSRKLTKTESLIAEKALLGFSRDEIAEMFECKSGKITRMLNYIYVKTNVKNRNEFMAKRIAYLEDMLHKHGIEYE